jgi:hypothetical protein
MTYTKKRNRKHKRSAIQSRRYISRKRRCIPTRRKRKSILIGGIREEDKGKDKKEKSKKEKPPDQEEDKEKDKEEKPLDQEEDPEVKAAKEKAAKQERCRKKKWNNFIIVDGKKQINDECWNPINQVGWYTHILNNARIYRHRLKTGWPRWEIGGRPD